MKRLSNLLAALVFASLVIFMSCGGGGGDDTPPDVRIEVADNLVSGTWANPTNVLTDNNTPDGDWDSFSLSFSGDENGGTYTVQNVPAGFESVWANGTWEFANTTGTSVTRVQGGVSTTVAITVTETALTLEFTVPEPARASNIGGVWRFEF